MKFERFNKLMFIGWAVFFSVADAWLISAGHYISGGTAMFYQRRMTLYKSCTDL